MISEASLSLTGEPRAPLGDESGEQDLELRALFSATSDVIFVLDRAGRYLKVTAQNPDLLYKPLTELIGKTMHEVLPAADADVFLEYIHRALATHRAVSLEYHSPIGEKEMWSAATVSPLNEDTVLWVARDITERKRAEQALRDSERKLAIMYDKAPFAGVLSRLPDGVIVTVNEAFERVFGFTKQEVEGKTSLELGINPDWERRSRIVVELQARGSVRDLELNLLTKSSEARVFLVNLNRTA